MVPFNKSKLTEYPLKALSEIEKRQKNEETRLYIYQILLVAAGLANDDFLLNKTLLDIKKFLSVSKGKNQNLIAIKNCFGVLSMFYRNKLLHNELENLTTFVENNFKIKTSGELTPLETNEAFFYLTVCVYVEYGVLTNGGKHNRQVSFSSYDTHTVHTQTTQKSKNKVPEVRLRSMCVN